MAGGTWRILVEEGKTSRPTQSTIVRGRVGSGTKPKLTPSGDQKEAKNVSVGQIQATIGIGLAIGAVAFNQYFTITGQSARKNALNATLTYGGAITSIGVQLATGNIPGAVITAAATTVAFGTQVANFQRNLIEENAKAEYLRQQSNTSISADRKQLYRFSLY